MRQSRTIVNRPLLLRIMLGMRTYLPCHIPDRWSRGANAFGQISPSASSTRDLGTRLNCMSLAVWLGEDRKCSAAVVGLRLVLGLSMVRRCSLNGSFKRRFVSPT